MDYPGDVSHIISFLPELYESNFPGFVVDPDFVARKRAQLREASRDPGQAVLVAEDGQGVCGFVWLIVEIEYSGRRRGEISAIHVASRVRGKGVGRELMEEAQALAKSYGCEVMHLMVTTTNGAAVGLYEGMGYKVTRYQMERPIR